MANEEYKRVYVECTNINTIAADYASKDSIEYYYQTKKLTHVTNELRRLVSDTTKTVLDVGCGCGIFLDIIRERFPGANTIGLDLSPVNCAAVAKKGHRSIQGDAEQLPVESNSVDLVLLLDVIEHLKGPTRVLSEAGRVLRRGGTLLLSTPSKFGIYEYKELVYFGFPYTLMDLLTLRMFRQKPRSYFPFHIRLYSEAELRRLLQEAGFHLFRSTKIDFCLPFLGNLNYLFHIYKSARFLKVLNVLEKAFPQFNHVIVQVARKK